VTRKILPSLALVALFTTVVLVPSGEAQTPRTAVKLFGCHFSADPLNRSFDLMARIKAIAGTRRMAIRFDVQVRRPGTKRYVAVHAAGFRSWLKSDRGVRVYERFRTVNGLEAPARYRVKVGYRWYSRTGKTLKTTWRLTRTCIEPDPRPDLRTRAYTTRHLSATQDEYRVIVRNVGRTTARGFSVSFFAPYRDPRVWDVTEVAPGLTWRRTFAGPRCTSGAPTVTADSGDGVDELHEGNNTVFAACSAG
jgi:CARDB